MMTINLPTDLETRLIRFITHSGQSADVLISQVINDYLDDQEDIALAEQRLKHPAKRLTMDEVVKELGLEH
jgi:predicted DNA-binding protein